MGALLWEPSWWDPLGGSPLGGRFLAGSPPRSRPPLPTTAAEPLLTTGEGETIWGGFGLAATISAICLLLGEITMIFSLQILKKKNKVLIYLAETNEGQPIG